MGLDNYQKNYIKRNLRHLPISKIAADLELPESEVLDYLKKKWSPEKYEKFLRNQHTKNSDPDQGITSFSFINFFRENWIAIAFLIFLVFAVYANSLGNGFVSDDIAGFAKNENIGRVSALFTGNLGFSPQGFFNFLAFHIGGLHPQTFRIMNILFHLSSTIIIFLLLSLAMNKRIAIIAASIFAVHPILIEAVGWISGAPYSLYTFFFLPSFLFYLFSKSNKKYLYYSIAFFILTLMSSGNAITLFLVFPLYELAFGNFRYDWKRILPFFAIGIFMMILLVLKIGGRVSAVESAGYQQVSGFWNPFIQIPVAISSYLSLIFWPEKLTLYHTEMAFSRGMYFFFILVFLAFSALIIYGYKKNKAIFFWLVFFVIPLLPTLTPFKISWIVAERYAYLGSLGIFVAVAMVFDKLSRLNENSKMIAYFFITLIIASLSVRTIIRNTDWKSEDTLWFATAKVAPSGQVIHNNLGDVYARQGNLEKSVEEFKKAIEINPNYADAYHNLANTYQQMGQTDAAVANYEKALSINPKLWQSYQNLAGIYFNQGDFQKALGEIQKALEIDPANENLKQNLEVIQSNIK